MRREEVQSQIKAFIVEVYENCSTRKEAADLMQRLNAFVASNGLSAEDLIEFAESGAGEILSMMVS